MVRVGVAVTYEIFIESTFLMELKDTICALATPQGGALGVIRISGSKAIAIAQ